MNLDKAVVIAWLSGAQVRMKIGCQAHMLPAKVTQTSGAAGKKVALICKTGCVLGEWDSLEELNAELNEIEGRVKATHLEPPGA